MIVLLGVAVLLIATVVVFFMARSMRLSEYRGNDLDRLRKAVAEDIAKVREDDKYFRADSPGQNPDDL